ncbi:MAG: hypothetical protein KDD02_02930 [Phaeodactylibacter sp.]|nr:hypothetical protein [Phaeodactylibacter sp.]MCB9301959.1 hypothetical protein [Lewinellaceae bacterium]
MKVFRKGLYCQTGKKRLPDIQKRYVEVVLGNPAERCAGTGICRVMMMSAVNGSRPEGFSSNCRSVIAACYLNGGQGVVLDIERPSIRPCSRRLFQGSTFLMERPVRLPRELELIWELPPCQLAAGKHPLIKGQEVLRLNIQLERLSRPAPEMSGIWSTDSFNFFNQQKMQIMKNFGSNLRLTYNENRVIIIDPTII